MLNEKKKEEKNNFDNIFFRENFVRKNCLERVRDNKKNMYKSYGLLRPVVIVAGTFGIVSISTRNKEDAVQSIFHFRIWRDVKWHTMVRKMGRTLI